MCFTLDHNIEFITEGKIFRLFLFHSVLIESSVDTLTDTATIELPESVMNEVVKIEDKVKRGSKVSIQLGYKGRLENEFEGYVVDVINSSSTLKIKCEDALFLFRIKVPDTFFKNTTVSSILNFLISKVDSSFTLSCDYNIGYEKFTIHQATAYDVLKKIREELHCNIYFDSINKVLHVHAPYKDKGGDVNYSMHKNIESSSLEYKRAIDRKFEITVESIGKDGKVKSVKAGTTGGDSVTIKVGSMTESDMQKIANAELSRRTYDGFEGSIQTWLRPVVKPTYSARFEDDDYPEKKGTYYVSAVTTKFSDSGGERTVTFGIKL